MNSFLFNFRTGESGMKLFLLGIKNEDVWGVDV